MNEMTFMKQVCSRIITKNNNIMFVGIITSKAKLITGRSKYGIRNPVIPLKIKKYPSWYEILAFLNSYDLKRIWQMREVVYVTLETSPSILVITPLSIDKEKFLVFLINNKENSDLAPTIEKILYEI